ncbi:MAG: hypothetical protein ABH887_00690 [bacterium]
MQKRDNLVLLLVVIMSLFMTVKTYAKNRVDAVPRLIEKNLLRMDYDEEKVKSFFVNISLNHGTSLSFYSEEIDETNETDKLGSFGLTGSKSIGPIVDVSFLVREENDIGVSPAGEIITNDITTHELSIDFHTDKFGLGMSRSFQDNNVTIATRHKWCDIITSFVSYETDGLWDFGVDLILGNVKLEIAHNTDEIEKIQLSFDLETIWGTLTPVYYIEDEVFGAGIVMLFP